MKRRELVRLACGAAAVRAFGLRAARAEPPTIPVVGFLGSESPALFDEQLRLFRKGLGDAGFVEGRNVAIEYRWRKARTTFCPSSLPIWFDARSRSSSRPNPRLRR